MVPVPEGNPVAIMRLLDKNRAIFFSASRLVPFDQIGSGSAPHRLIRQYWPMRSADGISLSNRYTSTFRQSYMPKFGGSSTIQ